jgi:hypothetical protein
VLSSRRRAIFPKWAFKKGSFLEPQNRRFDAQVQSLSKTGGARCEKNLFSIFVKIVLSSTRDAHFHKKNTLVFWSRPEGMVWSTSKMGTPLRRNAYFCPGPKITPKLVEDKKTQKTCDRQNMSPLCGDTPTLAREAAIFRTRRKSYKNADAGK